MWSVALGSNSSAPIGSVRSDRVGVLSEPVLEVAALACVEEVAAALEHCGGVARLSRLMDRCAGLTQRAGALHPAAGVFGATFHHQEVAGLGKHGRARLDCQPLLVR